MWPYSVVSSKLSENQNQEFAHQSATLHKISKKMYDLEFQSD
jgi:hypothetical protein